jgi:hypothetical protein
VTRLLSDAQVAERLSVSPSTAKRLRLAGAFPTTHLNGSSRMPRVLATDLDDYIASQAHGGSATATTARVVDLTAAMAAQRERIRREARRTKKPAPVAS